VKRSNTVARVKVVELKELTAQDAVEPVARLVLVPGEGVRIVELSPNTMFLVEKLFEHGIPGPHGPLFPQDGLAFIQRLPYVLHATYLWATEVFEMDAAEALAGMDQDTSNDNAEA